MINEKEFERLQDLENPNMLAENVENWFVEARQEGMQQGMQQGKQQGKLEMALELVRRFNVSVKVAAASASISVKELMDYIKQHDKPNA